jgi:phage tail protein X
MKISKVWLGLFIGLFMLFSTLNAKVTLPPSWTVTRVTYDTTVEELAQRYYGDSKDYIYILEANKNILHGSHIVPKNTEVKIPITEKFRDQPEKLGWE